MKLLVILNAKGGVAGATTLDTAPQSADRPTAKPIAGPGQKLVEIEVPDSLVPRRGAEPEAVRTFLHDLTARLPKPPSKGKAAKAAD